jgi:hypothetical protein
MIRATGTMSSIPGRPMSITALVLAVTVMGIGCRSSAQGPGAALDAYSKALRKQDYAAAYELMSSSFRDKHSKEEFVRMMKENSDEASETAERLRVKPKEMAVTAEFRYGLGDRMRLIREGDSWRIASNPIQLYSQATPREALRSFVRAYKLKRWDVMLRFVPNVYRERMDVAKLQRQFEGESREDVDVMMKMLEANIDEPITDKGDEARMTYGERYEVKFIREDGLWKIRDID